MKYAKTTLVTLSLVLMAFVSDGFADPPGLKGKEQLKSSKQGQWKADRKRGKELQKDRDERLREGQKDRDEWRRESQKDRDERLREGQKDRDEWRREGKKDRDEWRRESRKDRGGTAALQNRMTGF